MAFAVDARPAILMEVLPAQGISRYQVSISYQQHCDLTRVLQFFGFIFCCFDFQDCVLMSQALQNGGVDELHFGFVLLVLSLLSVLSMSFRTAAPGAPQMQELSMALAEISVKTIDIRHSTLFSI